MDNPTKIIFKEVRRADLMAKDGKGYRAIWYECSHCHGVFAEIYEDFHFCPGCGQKISARK